MIHIEEFLTLFHFEVESTGQGTFSQFKRIGRIPNVLKRKVTNDMNINWRTIRQIVRKFLAHFPSTVRNETMPETQQNEKSPRAIAPMKRVAQNQQKKHFLYGSSI